MNCTNNAGNGGAMSISNSDPSFELCSFTGCSSEMGGAVFVSNPQVTSAPVFNDVLFQSNTASSGGGIFVGQISMITMNSVRFLSNNAMNSGGGLYVTADNAMAMSNCGFLNNTAGTGGGIFGEGGVQLQMDTMVFTANSAVDGAGAFVQSGDVNIGQGSVFDSNRATSTGGCIKIHQGSSNLGIAFSQFKNNIASMAGGMALLFLSSFSSTSFSSLIIISLHSALVFTCYFLPRLYQCGGN